MDIWILSLTILNTMTFSLLVMQIRERQGLERDLAELQEEHYELRKETGRLSPSEKIRESAQRLSDAMVKSWSGHGDYWSGRDSRG